MSYRSAKYDLSKGSTNRCVLHHCKFKLSPKHVSSREQKFQVIPVSTLSMIPGKLLWSRQLRLWFIAVKFAIIEVPSSCRRSWNKYELEHKHARKWCQFCSIHSSSTVYSRFHRLQHSKLPLPLSTLKTVTGRWYFGLEHVTESKYELNWVIRKSMFCHSMFKICRLGALGLIFLLSCVQVVNSSLDNAMLKNNQSKNRNRNSLNHAPPYKDDFVTVERKLVVLSSIFTHVLIIPLNVLF